MIKNKIGFFLIFYSFFSTIHQLTLNAADGGYVEPGSIAGGYVADGATHDASFFAGASDQDDGRRDIEGGTHLTDGPVHNVERGSDLDVREPSDPSKSWYAKELSRLCYTGDTTTRCETCGLHLKPATGRHSPIICALGGANTMRISAVLARDESRSLAAARDDFGNTALLLAVAFFGYDRDITHRLLRDHLSEDGRAFEPNNNGANVLFVCISSTKNAALFRALMERAPEAAKKAKLLRTDHSLLTFAQHIRDKVINRQVNLELIPIGEHTAEIRRELEELRSNLHDLAIIMNLIKDHDPEAEAYARLHTAAQEEAELMGTGDIPVKYSSSCCTVS